MSLQICTGKLHRVFVTEARLDYQGSITIDPVLMAAADILPFQLVHVNNLSNAAHWETYVIPGKPHSGSICLNGSPARLYYPGDQVIIMSFENMSREDASKALQKVVFVDQNNQIVRVETKGQYMPKVTADNNPVAQTVTLGSQFVTTSPDKTV